MTKKLPRRYWDSCAFLGILLGEADKVPLCTPVLEAAEAGDLTIVTSAITLAEVIKTKGQPRIKEDDEKKVREFFQHHWIVIQECDRRIAEHARQLMWINEALNHKDAIHVATAIQARVVQLDTFDEPLIKLSGKLGNPPLTIGYPNLPNPQMALEYSESQNDDGYLEVVEDAEEES